MAEKKIETPTEAEVVAGQARAKANATETTDAPTAAGKRSRKDRGRVLTTKKGLELLSTGCTVYDLALGGGYPIGRVVNVVGHESSGKTLLAMELLARSFYDLKDKFSWYYDDAEAGFSFDPEEIYGIKDMLPDRTKKSEMPSDTVEDLEASFVRRLEKKDPKQALVYVVDSLDALSAKAEGKRAEERRKAINAGKEPKGSYGMEKAKTLSEIFRLLALDIERYRALLLILSQVRENTDQYGPKYKRSGGKALDMYASQIVWLREVERFEKRGRVTGVCVEAVVKKNKVGLPFRKCYINIIFDYGVDDVSTNIDYLYGLKTQLGKLGAAAKKPLAWDGQDLTREELIQYIEENDQEQALRQAVIDSWNEVEESISSSHRKRRF